MYHINKKIFFLTKLLRVAMACLTCTALSSYSYAELTPISDSEMSNVTGQATVSIDKYAYAGHDFTRINLGLDIETQINIDTLEMGTYHRWENHPSTPSLNGTMCATCTGAEAGLEAQGSDIKIDNFSLGSIDPGTGEIQPFSITDPFIEIAYDDAGAASGFRVGFGKAKGWLSGDIRSLTGNVDISIQDTARGLGETQSNCSLSGAYSCLLGGLLGALGPTLLGEAPLQSDALLVNAEGEPDPIRATMLGMQSGSALTVDSKGELGFFDGLLVRALVVLTPGRYNASMNGDIIKFHSSGCDILTINLCFPLTNFKSFELGRDKPEGTDGFFISAQTEAVEWAQTFQNGPGSTVTSGQATGLGSYFNLPNNGIVVNLDEALNGIPRLRTEYIDRGHGLF